MIRWQVVRLGDVCKIAKTKHDGELLPYLGMEHIESGTGRLAVEPTATAVKSATFRFDESHLLYGRLRPYLNKVLVPDFEGHCSTEIFPLECGGRLDRQFLFYWLTSEITVRRISRTSTGTRMPRANVNVVLDFDFPLPSLAEQEQIVVILDEAFAAIATAAANTKRNLVNARELFDSCVARRLHGAALQTPTQELTDITELVVDCEHKTAPTQDTGYPSIRTPNIGKGHLLLDGVKRVSEETYRGWTRRAVPKPGDLILAREAPAGNVGVIPEGESVCLGQRTVLIRPVNNMVNSHYLAFLLLHPAMQQRLLAHATGATVEHVNMRDIRALAIGELPSVEDQQATAEYILVVQQQSEILVNAVDNKRLLLAQLRRSILHKAFTGELTAGPQAADRALSQAGI